MKKDVIWGYLAQFLQYGAALLVLPLLLRKLTSVELGVWYVFMTISALVTMLDMGFTPTLARNVSYVLGGAKRLLKDGYEVVDNPGTVDYGLLRAIIVASKRIFLWISIGAFSLLAVPGTIYIFHISQGQIDGRTVGTAWLLFVIATVINLYYKYYTPLLQGRGLYAGFYKSSAIANIVFIAVTVILLILGFGLLAVSIGFFVSALVGRWLSCRYFYNRQFQSDLAVAAVGIISTKEIIRTLWHNSWRLGLGVIGGFLILKANTLLSSVYLGLSTTAAYALTLHCFSVMQSLSMVIFNVQQPKIAQFYVSNQSGELLRIIELGLGSSVTIFFVGVVMLVFCGDGIVGLAGGNTQLLPMPLLIWLGLILLLELNHSLAAGVIVTGNNVPFFGPAIISGFCVVFLSWLGLEFFDGGICWMIFSQFIVQLLYNNWKWPLLVSRRLGCNYLRIFWSGFLLSFNVIWSMACSRMHWSRRA